MPKGRPKKPIREGLVKLDLLPETRDILYAEQKLDVKFPPLYEIMQDMLAAEHARREIDREVKNRTEPPAPKPLTPRP